MSEDSLWVVHVQGWVICGSPKEVHIVKEGLIDVISGHKVQKIDEDNTELLSP